MVKWWLQHFELVSWVRLTVNHQGFLEFTFNMKIFWQNFSDFHLHSLTRFAWEKWLKRFGDSHRINYFHVAMIMGIIYTNLAIFLSLWGTPAFLCEYSKLVYTIPFIIATWKRRILWPSSNLFNHLTYGKLVKFKLKCYM